MKKAQLFIFIMLSIFLSNTFGQGNIKADKKSVLEHMKKQFETRLNRPNVEIVEPLEVLMSWYNMSDCKGSMIKNCSDTNLLQAFALYQSKVDLTTTEVDFEKQFSNAMKEYDRDYRGKIDIKQILDTWKLFTLYGKVVSADYKATNYQKAWSQYESTYSKIESPMTVMLKKELAKDSLDIQATMMLMYERNQEAHLGEENLLEECLNLLTRTREKNIPWRTEGKIIPQVEQRLLSNLYEQLVNEDKGITQLSCETKLKIVADIQQHYPNKPEWLTLEFLNCLNLQLFMEDTTSEEAIALKTKTMSLEKQVMNYLNQSKTMDDAVAKNIFEIWLSYLNNKQNNKASIYLNALSKAESQHLKLKAQNIIDNRKRLEKK